MTPGALLFRAGAFVALILLILHARRTEGGRATAILVVYLFVMATVREWAVAQIVHAIDMPVPYQANGNLGRLGVVNVVVVAGWVFTALLSFAVAKMIQQRNLPGTNIFLTLALTALVTSTISYGVELTGMRIRLWQWWTPHPVEWLPFEYPEDAFEGWPATTFMLMLIYCTWRYRLFSNKAWRRAAALIALVALFGLSDLAQRWLIHSPRKKLTVVYLMLSTLLGFWSPRSWLGSSEEALWKHAGKDNEASAEGPAARDQIR